MSLYARNKLRVENKSKHMLFLGLGAEMVWSKLLTLEIQVKTF